MSSATMRDLLYEMYSGMDWEEFPIVMPLVTSLSIISPDDVIGFGITTLGGQERKVIVIKNRNWESNAQWTGMSADLYNANAVDEKDAIDTVKGLLADWHACLSYAGRLTSTAFLSLGISAFVVPLPNVARFAEVGRIPAALKARLAEGEDLTFHEVLKELAASAMPRMISRAELERRLMVPRGDGNRPELPIVDSTLLRDAAIWRKCLGMPATIDIA